jgi:hypothetical protein
MKRTWYRQKSDGTFFRNCPLIMQELERARLPWVVDQLDREWNEVFHKGVVRQAEIPRGDKWIEYDDSPEATQAWVEQTLAKRGLRNGH